MSRSLVIIPTYNEILNISDIIDAVLVQDSSIEVLVVDDNSPDGTADVVREKQQESDSIHLIQRTGKQGLGTAYIAGFKYGLKQGFDLIYEMDADFSHNPKNLLDLKTACDGGADVAIGSRYVPGGGVVNWPKDRIILSKGASLYVRMITLLPIHDPTAGFICYKRSVLEAIDLDKITSVGYAFQIEMKYAAFKKGFTIVEVPITFKDREKGVSKLDTSIISEAVKGVLHMRWKGIRGYYH